MKITSVTAIKPGDIPVRKRNTENAQLAVQISADLKRLGGSVKVNIEGASKYLRYALQRALRKAGHKAARVSQQGNTFYVTG